MVDEPNCALAVVADRRALAWVLEHATVAFPEPRSRILPFRAGDSIYLYTTRGCFRNPTRDRSRIIGKALALTDLRVNEDPVRFGDRSFPLEVRVRIDSLAPVGDGINFADLVPQLTSFPKPERWSVYLRRSAFSITPKDARRFDRLLAPFEGQHLENLGG
jgi:hypothetical protein